MSKILELEKTMVNDELSESLFEEYKKALNRVHNNFLKRQHCYTTAIQFPADKSEQAIRLIEYGLKNYPDDWFSTYSSYLYIGVIYERAGEYRGAYEAYLSAYYSLPSDKVSYINSISGKLMWMQLHVDSFCYSEKFEKYYEAFNEVDEFERSILNNEFMLSVGKIVISKRNNDINGAKEARERALSLCSPGAVGKLQKIFDRHRYTDKLHATPEAITFVKSVKLR